MANVAICRAMEMIYTVLLRILGTYGRSSVSSEESVTVVEFVVSSLYKKNFCYNAIFTNKHTKILTQVFSILPLVPGI